METKYLSYFLQICKDKSLSKASKNLYISQQALSSIVRKLEAELQVSLFERSNNGMILTEYGEYFKNQACKIVDTINDTKQKLEALKSGYREILNIGMSFGVMSALPSSFISGFQKLYPHIELQFTEYQDTLCEEAVFNEHESLGFSIAPVNPERFDFHTVIRDKICILVNEKNPLSSKSSVCFEDLKDEQFLILNNNFKLRRIFNENCRKSGFEPHIALETMELILIHNFSKLNKGIGVSVDFIAHDIANVRPIPIEPECPWEVCTITKKGKHLSDAARRFIQYIEQFGCYYPAEET